MKIRPAQDVDVSGIVEVHMRAFSRFFLTSLGRGFNRELYRNFVAQPGGICLVAEEEGRVAGFAAGAVRPEEFFSRMRKRRWHVFLLYYMRGILLHPVLTFRRLIDAARYKGDNPDSVEGAALLSSFAVDPEFSRRGFGRALLHEFCKEAAGRGATHVYLTTDRDNNEPVNRFYRDSGFELESTFKKYGYRYMNRYVIELPRDGETSPAR